MSGMVCFSSTTGALKAPTEGGEVTFVSVEGKCWFRRASECVRPAYIWKDEQCLLEKTERGAHILDRDICASYQAYLAYGLIYVGPLLRILSQHLS